MTGTGEIVSSSGKLDFGHFLRLTVAQADL